MELKNLKTMFLNPIVIATFLGLFVWLLQGYLPQMSVATEDGAIQQFAFLRIDQTAVWLFKPMTYLAGLASPLAWLSIGSTLGEISFKSAATDKTSWYYSIVKVWLVPIVNIILLALLTVSHILSVDSVALSTIVIMMATPTATVAAAYAISFDKEAILTSNASLLSTITSVVMIPVWIITLNIIDKIGIF
nr:AEC family transporter [Paenibacillus sp. RC343]